MQYTISTPHPASHFIEIEFTINKIETDSLLIQLPSWRPGRYELGNFAKNIQHWKAYDSSGNLLVHTKTSKDSWQVETNGSTSIVIKYNYYAAQADAGACWLDEKMLYINPVHCMLYDPDRMNEACTVTLNVPADYTIACGLKSIENKLYADNYHQLVDSPFIASPTLQHKSYEVNNVPFHVWIQGECKPDWDQLIKDFKGFTTVQMEMMRTFPAADYHFLILVLPFRFYHGVEHTNSTVLALGPGYQLMSKELYNDLLGVASHELFHAWNVKTIRPVEMQPYDYTRENYSRLGWVYEGFTTYYGDLFLARSGFFNMKDYFNELNVRLQKHVDNYGRFNLSVASSSFDTWLDGYTPGIPDRKTSIYDEGSLIALMLDLFIRKSSNHFYSLDDVMRSLNTDFAMKNRGYTEQDIITLVEYFAAKPVDDIFINYINGTIPYENYLQSLLHEVGCYISKSKSPHYTEEQFGFKVITDVNGTRVSAIAPGSPADKAGLTKDDELICVSNFKVDNNLDELLHLSHENEATIEVFTQRKKRIIKLQVSGKTYYSRYKVELISDANDEQKKAFSNWSGISVTM